MEANRRYGYFDTSNSNVTIQMRRGQNIAGYPIGIVYIEDVFYPMVPGNIVNGYTFPFPVRLKAVEGLDCQNLFDAAAGVYEMELKN